MSTNGGIFARISPLSERILAVVARFVGEGKGKGRLDLSREAWRSRGREGGRKEGEEKRGERSERLSRERADLKGFLTSI